MLKLVETVKTSLNKEELTRLMSMVRASETRDTNFFNLCRKLSKRVSSRQENIVENAEGLEGGPNLDINLFHAHVKSLLPTIYFQNPYVEVLPRDNMHHESSAPVWEGFINNVLELTKYKKETKKVVQDAIIKPEGWKKWTVIAGGDENSLLGGGGESGELTEITENKTETNHLNVPVGVRLKPEDVITDSPDRSIEKSRYIAIKYKRLVSELIADPRYSFTDQDAAFAKPTSLKEGNFLENKPTMLGSEIAEEDDWEVTLYEVWIYQHVKLGLYKQVVWYIDEFPNKTVRGPLPWSDFVGDFMHRYPFSKLELNSINDDKPVGELEIFKSIQSAVNWLQNRLIMMVADQRSLHNFYAGNAVNAETAKAQVTSGRSTEFIEAREEGKPVIEPVPHKPIASDNYQVVQLLMSFFQQVTGFGMNRRGGSGIRTASEAKIVESGTQIRTDEKVDIVKDFLQEDIDILVRILRSTATRDQVFYSKGTVGALPWQQFTDQEAQWQPDIRIRPHSFRNNLDQERLNDLNVALQTGVQLSPIFGESLRLDVLYRRMLEQLEIPNVSEIMADSIDARIEQMLELINMILGKEVPVAMEHDHRTHLAVLVDFAQTEAMAALPEESQIAIQEHMQQHDTAIQELEANAPSGSSNTNSFSNEEAEQGSRADLEGDSPTIDSRGANAQL